MIEWSDFILTEINGCYKINDWLEFILMMIKRDYGMNDWSKLALNKEKDH